MKKFFAMVLAAVMVCGMMSVACAATGFNVTTSVMSGFPPVTVPAVSTGSNWHITWGEGCNIASNRRAVVRALSEDGSAFASSLFVYSTTSAAYHPYKDAYINKTEDSEIKTCVGIRLDDRDGAQAPMKVNGIFHN